jgi:D-glucosaminate-6-phosphate ammonia-lyase
MANIFQELGVRPVLNAHGNRTALGGNTPSPAVRALMDEMEDYYVDMGDLVDSVGERVSEMLGVEAALVTSGCAAALAVGAAACMTGDDPDKMEQIPDTTGMPDEFIIQRQLRVRYDRAMTIPGGKLVVIGHEDKTTPEQLEEAIGPNTAGIHYLAPGTSHPGALPIEDVIRIGHSHDIPIIVDAAGQVYPIDNLSRYAKMGADLVAYGAKYFGSVNSSGLLTGRKDLVGIARTHSSIGFESTPVKSFGRPMKIDRQEVVAVYAALREWLTTNHEDRFAAYETRMASLRADLTGIPGLTFFDSPEDGPADGLGVTIDSTVVGMTAEEIAEELKDGNPSIWVRHPVGPDSLVFRMPTLRPGGEQVIAQTMRELLA